MSTNDASPDSAAEKDAGFDQTLAALKRLVEQLEGGQLSLERSLAAFEDGVRLARRGAAILDTAERRVEVLLKPEPGQGAAQAAMVAPFADDSVPQNGPERQR